MDIISRFAPSLKSTTFDGEQNIGKDLSLDLFGEQEKVSSQHVPLTRTTPSIKFDVSMHFPSFSPTSIKLAQSFVVAALSFPRVKAYRNRKGIGNYP